MIYVSWIGLCIFHEYWKRLQSSTTANRIQLLYVLLLFSKTFGTSLNYAIKNKLLFNYALIDVNFVNNKSVIEWPLDWICASDSDCDCGWTFKSKMKASIIWYYHFVMNFTHFVTPPTAVEWHFCIYLSLSLFFFLVRVVVICRSVLQLAQFSACTSMGVHSLHCNYFNFALSLSLFLTSIYLSVIITYSRSKSLE